MLHLHMQEYGDRGGPHIKAKCDDVEIAGVVNKQILLAYFFRLLCFVGTNTICDIHETRCCYCWCWCTRFQFMQTHSNTVAKYIRFAVSVFFLLFFSLSLFVLFILLLFFLRFHLHRTQFHWKLYRKSYTCIWTRSGFGFGCTYAENEHSLFGSCILHTNTLHTYTHFASIEICFIFVSLDLLFSFHIFQFHADTFFSLSQRSFVQFVCCCRRVNFFVCALNAVDYYGCFLSLLISFVTLVACFG